MEIDTKLKTLLENGVKEGHRTLFAIVGENAKKNVLPLNYLLKKTTNKSNLAILWCLKKDLNYSNQSKKHVKKLQVKIKAGKMDLNQDDPFDVFLATEKINYCFYHDTQTILGQTFDLCILEDFEALTPNLLARTIETVQGGGVIIMLLKNIKKLKSLYTLEMDVHQKLKTEGFNLIEKSRFNERFILSFPDCNRIITLDENLNILPICRHNLNDDNLMCNDINVTSNVRFQNLNDSIKGILDCCKTSDQAKILQKFFEILSDNSAPTTVSLTASRGRGKSASLGLATALAVFLSYSNIYITSPGPENLKTFFDFLFLGLKVLNYELNKHYTVKESFLSSTQDYSSKIKVVNRVDFLDKSHKRSIQYIEPLEFGKLSQVDLLVIDEAAAIPLPVVKKLQGQYLVFLASTINGYEGTGRSLSLKLLQELRLNQIQKDCKKDSKHVLHELTLNEPIRYKLNDPIENWLTKILCLDSTNVQVLNHFPKPEMCNLYYVNRDTLFSYHGASEEFLQNLISLYISSHYKNSPNDLQMIADAPSHHLFCLLGPIDLNSSKTPEVLVVIQVCLEGKISKKSVLENFSRGKRASGDLIPWTIAQQFQDSSFAQLAGARIVRIATHPDCQSMGYGRRALSLLQDYYGFKVQNSNFNEVKEDENEPKSESEDEGTSSLKEKIRPRKNLQPLLQELQDRKPEKLDYLGVSFGLTEQLLKFWKRSGFVPVYLRQTANEITGENSCVMLNILQGKNCDFNEEKLKHYWIDFRKRFINLLSYQFSEFKTSVALGVLDNKFAKIESRKLSRNELERDVSALDAKRLQMYGNNLVDYHLIIDLMPTIGKLYFKKELGDLHFSALQQVIIVAIGLQHKSIDKLAEELQIEASELLGLFHKVIRRVSQYFDVILNEDYENEGANNQLQQNRGTKRDIVGRKDKNKRRKGE